MTKCMRAIIKCLGVEVGEVFKITDALIISLIDIFDSLRLTLKYQMIVLRGKCPHQRYGNVS